LLTITSNIRSTHRQPPIRSGTRTDDQLSPKAALVWSPREAITVRGIYTKSMGGVSVDESYRLEADTTRRIQPSVPHVDS
jgi:outer membrane receptor protein involved in Fe transport